MAECVRVAELADAYVWGAYGYPCGFKSHPSHQRTPPRKFRRGFCNKKRDLNILDTYIDHAMAGTNDNRVAFQKMLKDSSRKEWQYVLLYKLDRFSRNKFESVIHKKTLRDNGVTIFSAMENLTDSPKGRMWNIKENYTTISFRELYPMTYGRK